MTQFINFQKPLFLPSISWILVSKNTCLVFLITFLKIFQSSTHFEVLYFSSSLWHSLFHHNFECFVILTIFEYSNQILSIFLANSCTIHSRSFLLGIYSIFSSLIDMMSLARKFFSSSLFLIIFYFLVYICSSNITILTVSRVWFDNSLHSRWIVWVLNSDEVSWRNMRLITKFKLFWLSEYLVKT